MLTDKDRIQIQEKGIKEAGLQMQLENFRKGFPPVRIVKPCTIGDGIISLPEEKASAYAREYDNLVGSGIRPGKFVPASGAASRMFKHLHSYNGNGQNQAAIDFFKDIEKFSFYRELQDVVSKESLNLRNLADQEKYDTLIEYIISDKGLNYGHLPKGLISFHQYHEETRTAFEEHLVEAAKYATDNDHVARIQFTISPEHRERITGFINQVKGKYEDKFQVKFEITYSIQKPSTDMVAVDMKNELFREEDGSLLFRPGGHGALLENLFEAQGDIIFIKNIDNVVPDHLKNPTFLYKKALGGILTNLKQKIDQYLTLLDSDNVDEARLYEMESFTDSELFANLPVKNNDVKERKKILYNILNRPLRVCGMVKNEGEPGGGPFWVMDEENNVSKQIVEKAQIDTNDRAQVEMFNNATHFNPVDIVCSIKDHRGKKYDLFNYRNSQTGFITQKSKNGRELKAQELPGLWNGAMAYWNTIFAEVPLITFNPVKTVNDLLRKEHQPA